MFVDVKESRAGGVERFQQRLVASQAGPQGQMLVVGGSRSAAMPTIPSRAHVIGGSGSGGSSQPPVRDLRGPKEPARNVRSVPDRNQDAQEDEGDMMPRFLLLCVNTRNLTRLIQVDLSYVGNDQLLFDSIRQRYWEARRHNSWHYGLLIPRWLAIRMPDAWNDWLRTVHLLIPRSAELIEVSSF